MSAPTDQTIWDCQYRREQRVNFAVTAPLGDEAAAKAAAEWRVGRLNLESEDDESDGGGELEVEDTGQGATAFIKEAVEKSLQSFIGDPYHIILKVNNARFRTTSAGPTSLVPIPSYEPEGTVRDLAPGTSQMMADLEQAAAEGDNVAAAGAYDILKQIGVITELPG